ncbi:helix-turn-helix transcriptional regulator [Salinicoccus sp. YB14-2]|uniref:ArsR/SmtB family transcription factor n=1 Tax=Salinicoccus sp. YB14-2 TaxID=1572701 RepID=UPI00068D48AA|nr:metalloregulator ArsR/SmtB family transcription factor [Salinicoccus sp. YB14-2]
MTYENLSSYLKIIANPSRLEILDLLSCGELCADDLLKYFDFSQPTLSHHMKALADNNLIEIRRDGNKKMYKLNNEVLEKVSSYINLIARDNEECVCKSISKGDCAS